MSVNRAAYDASFAKLVSFVAYRDSRRSENHRNLRGQFDGQSSVRFSKICFSIIGNCLGKVWELPPPNNKNTRKL